MTFHTVGSPPLQNEMSEPEPTAIIGNLNTIYPQPQIKRRSLLGSLFRIPECCSIIIAARPDYFQGRCPSIDRGNLNWSNRACSRNLFIG